MKKYIFVLGTAAFLSTATIMMSKTDRPAVSVSPETPSFVTSAALGTSAAGVESAKPAPFSNALQKQIEETEHSLASIEQVKKAGEDLHETPPEVLKGGRALGELVQYLEDHPGEFEQASAFYANCATDTKLLPAMRVICYHELSGKQNQWAPGVKEKVATVPAKIIEVSKSL